MSTREKNFNYFVKERDDKTGLKSREIIAEVKFIKEQL